MPRQSERDDDEILKTTIAPRLVGRCVVQKKEARLKGKRDMNFGALRKELHQC